MEKKMETTIMGLYRVLGLGLCLFLDHPWHVFFWVAVKLN